MAAAFLQAACRTPQQKYLCNLEEQTKHILCLPRYPCSSFQEQATRCASVTRCDAWKARNKRTKAYKVYEKFLNYSKYMKK